MRKHFIFSGKVQNVGFRPRAKYAANGMGITGWVKNQWDGTVEMEAQGTKEQIDMLLVRINQGEYIQIDNIETREIPEIEETGFHIR